MNYELFFRRRSEIGFKTRWSKRHQSHRTAECAEIAGIQRCCCGHSFAYGRAIASAFHPTPPHTSAFLRGVPGTALCFLYTFRFGACCAQCRYRATHDEHILGTSSKSAGRPPLARSARSSPFLLSTLAVLIGRRWATTPRGGGVQKAGVENTAGVHAQSLQPPDPLMASSKRRASSVGSVVGSSQAWLRHR